MPKQAHAGTCTASEQDKAEYLAEKAGREIIEEYGGGQDERVKLTSCSFNSYTQTFKLNIEVYWSGLIFSFNKYNVDGYLELDYDGSDARFSRTYANENVKNLELLVGTVILLDILTDESGSSGGSSQGYDIKFTNNCDRPVRFIIRYYSPDIGWEVDGWWMFDPYESAYLLADGNRLKTNKVNMYYYAESDDGSNLYWIGDYQYYFEGIPYDMRKIEDDRGETNLSISCPR